MKTRLGHYDIVSELGRGGMGVVYKGYESTLHRYVAIKVLADALAHDEAVRERFVREARSMAALNDPHIIQIYFIGEDQGQPFFVMEFVEGESLGSMLKRDHRLTVEQAAKIIHQTAQGLATAHDAGVIHRDIKPGNLMITARGQVKIADFGIALSNQDLSKKLTSTGEFVGTPGYLSPEVCLGKPVDRRSDIFSLGIVLFEMLTGKMPFNDESPLGLMLEVVRAEIPDVRSLNSDADPDIARILSRMIVKEPADRYQSCHELVADLAAHPLVARGGPITVQTKLSPAAATMVGQKTPVSGRVELPVTPPPPSSAGASTRITPAPATAPPAHATVASAGHRSVLGRSGERAPGPGLLPWAVAAVLVLGVAGAAWGWRAQLPGVGNWFGSGAASMASTAPAAAPAADAAVATSPTRVDDASTPEAAPPFSGNLQAAMSQAPEALPAAPAANEDAVADAAAPAADGALQIEAAADWGHADASAQPGGPADAARAEAASAPAAAASTETAGEAVAAAAAPAAVAKASPPKPAAPPRPAVPTIAVVTGGDDVISGPAMEEALALLRGSGFRVIEGAHINGDRPDLARYAGRADAVLVINARPVGSQQLQFYGQSTTLYTVQLGMRLYRVSDRSLAWGGGTTQVDFTSLNAAEKAREAIMPMLDRADGSLAEFRSRRRG